MDRYEDFVSRQGDKVDRTRELERFHRRLRWWALSLVLAIAVFTIVLVTGELT